MINADHGVILDVEATLSIRYATVSSARTMPDRVEGKLDLHPERLICWGGRMLGWLIGRKIAPHISVFDTSVGSDCSWLCGLRMGR